MKKKLDRILFISEYFPPFTKGGGEISTSILVKYLSKKYHCDVLTSKFSLNNWTYSNANILPKLFIENKEGIINKRGLVHIFNTIIYKYINFFIVLSFIKKYDPDIVNVIPHSYRSILLIIASIVLNKPTVIDARAYSIVNIRYKDNTGKSNRLKFSENAKILDIILESVYFIYDLINFFYSQKSTHYLY